MFFIPRYMPQAFITLLFLMTTAWNIVLKCYHVQMNCGYVTDGRAVGDAGWNLCMRFLTTFQLNLFGGVKLLELNGFYNMDCMGGEKITFRFHLQKVGYFGISKSLTA